MLLISDCKDLPPDTPGQDGKSLQNNKPGWGKKTPAVFTTGVIKKG